MRIVAINLDERKAVRDDGRIVPITHLFDHGEDTEDASLATAFVAGDGSEWFSYTTDGFAPPVLN